MGVKRKAPAGPSRGFDVSGGSGASSANPFEEKWARRAANRSLSASAAASARVAALRASGRVNSFADRRIAEDNPDVPEEDRYLARLQKDRSKRAAKRARFNLAEAGDRDEDGKSFGRKVAEEAAMAMMIDWTF
jgi:Nop14-like family